jgi:hypothetical protein
VQGESGGQGVPDEPNAFRAIDDGEHNEAAPIRSDLSPRRCGHAHDGR